MLRLPTCRESQFVQISLGDASVDQVHFGHDQPSHNASDSQFKYMPNSSVGACCNCSGPLWVMSAVLNAPR